MKHLDLIPAEREIRAFFTSDFIRVYQAFNESIAQNAVTNQSFCNSDFKKNRTTWIKPSFCWMMYRSGWGSKQNQERILAIDIKHEGFKWAIINGCPSSFDNVAFADYNAWKKSTSLADVIIQWDPERDIHLNKLNYRTIQIGLKPRAVHLYTTEWILKITDITESAKRIKSLIDRGKLNEAEEGLPIELPYNPLDF
ncbi:DUF4291 domain-containing protein [Flaviaesturariibacter aridisoli]|uniref:DUF4291 domain-containing protein n=1 Tax=Flaviaesturariibacter aridisoli TaxID=2545761 RepID=A0A4R4DRW1_9BACT|nr:DUF4291 domain-containing protein [Flaviaesturariibacter aridisoli]TCZ64240.1 DUF4291 domain-containing protein [Flaviaesturariibacter aridisoli]